MSQYRVSLGQKYERPLVLIVSASGRKAALKEALSRDEAMKHFQGDFPQMRSVEPVYDRANLDVLLESCS